MINASQIRAGMAIRYESQPYKVIAADYHPGQGKMGGVNHMRLKNLVTGAIWEHSFRAELKIEELPVERQTAEFLYADGDNCFFMNPQSYEQVEISFSRYRGTAEISGRRHANTYRVRRRTSYQRDLS
jgi:elongation factor P